MHIGGFNMDKIACLLSAFFLYGCVATNTDVVRLHSSISNVSKATENKFSYHDKSLLEINEKLNTVINKLNRICIVEQDGAKMLAVCPDNIEGTTVSSYAMF